MAISTELWKYYYGVFVYISDLVASMVVVKRILGFEVKSEKVYDRHPLFVLPAPASGTDTRRTVAAI